MESFFSELFSFFKSQPPAPVKEQLPTGEVHYTAVPLSAWRWTNFTPKELSSKSDGLILIDENALDALQKFRDIVGVPFTPNSAYRSESHNRKVGGAKNSQHRLGRAFDIPITKNMTREVIKNSAKAAGFTGFGDYPKFVHIDIGPARYWDER